MQRWHEQYLGLKRFPASLSSVEIEHNFTLSESELKYVSNRRRPLNRLGVALQIGFLRMTGQTLNSFQMVPQAVLKHLGDQLHVLPPQLASIRALYRRRRTMFDHQHVALEALGFRDAAPHAERALTAFLRRSAETTFRLDALVQEAQSWFYEHRYVAPAKRRLNSLVRGALRHVEREFGKEVTSTIGASVLSEWRAALLQRRSVDDRTNLEWLREPPEGKGPRDVSDQFDKYDFLSSLGVDRRVSLSRLYFYARPMLRRRPMALQRLKEPRRSIELVCLLRWLQLELTESCMKLFDHRSTDLWRQAQQRARERQLEYLEQHQRLIPNIRSLIDDDSIPAGKLRKQLSELITPFEQPSLARSHSAITRYELSKQSRRLRPLMKRAASMPLEIDEGNPLKSAMDLLRSAYEGGHGSVPPGTSSLFPKAWRDLIDSKGSEQELGACEAAAMMTLKRSLRNGSAVVGHSLSYRHPEDLLVPRVVWSKDRARLYRHLKLPQSVDRYLRRLTDAVQVSLHDLARAVTEGLITIDRDRIRVPRPKPKPEDQEAKELRRAVFQPVETIQLPDLLVDVDSHTRFSWLLLGRSPKSERELVTLYWAVMALASDLTGAEVTRMIPELSEQAVGSMMRLTEEDQRLRRANDAVVKYLRSHEVAAAWGSGLFASSDITSLEATRHLWNARLDPRRRTYAVGTYTHVLDQWTVIYDQPIVLNQRQAGAAIEGALRQSHVELEKLAVDTHGFTHFAMAFAKLLGLDLCPRLAGLGQRKLLIPRGIDIPAVLKPVTERVPLGPKVKEGWEGLVRLAASVDAGWCQAAYALDRYGSAGRGDPVYECGTALGKILRTIYLGDYLCNLAFRREMLELLNQGESVHQLQRAIHNGPVTAKRGRSREQLKAISGALSLLTNAVMAWNTARIQSFIDEQHQSIPREVLADLAPVAFSHINMRGIFDFDLTDRRNRLFQTPVEARARGNR